MSHFTKLDRAQITNAEAFVAAMAELGFKKVRKNCISKDYYGNTVNAAVAVSIDGTYDIALVRRKDGKFDTVADWSMMNVGNFKGGRTAFQNRMLQLTTKHTIISTYRRRGFRASVKEDPTGNMTVKLTRA